MDIEKFTTEKLKDELLKVVDELQTRGYDFEFIEDHIRNGERNQHILE
jgi:SOS response regulatory protein OraA/RecX